MFQAKEVKNASMTCVSIHNKEINSLSSVRLDIKEEICIGKLICYEADQAINDDIFTKLDLENLLGKKFDIVIEDDDCENTYNNIITIKNCYMYKYSYFIAAGNMRMMLYEFSFSKENKREAIKS